jgi:hypothetical protein
VSTRYRLGTLAPDHPWQALPRVRRERLDVAEQVALVAQTRRESLLRRHRHRLRLEDLEDCLSQATLELLVQVRAGGSYASSLHLANVLEQRFRSRIMDRLRAVGGRSPIQAAMEQALVLGDPARGEVEVADLRLGVEELVMLRLRLDRPLMKRSDNRMGTGL